MKVGLYDRHATARANIDAAMSSGIAAVHKLDAIITNRLRGDPGTMAAWRRDRRAGVHGLGAASAPGGSRNGSTSRRS